MIFFFCSGEKSPVLIDWYLPASSLPRGQAGLAALRMPSCPWGSCPRPASNPHPLWCHWSTPRSYPYSTSCKVSPPSPPPLRRSAWAGILDPPPQKMPSLWNTMIRMVVLVPWIHLDVVNVNIFHISGFQGTPAGLRISARHDVTCMPTSPEFRVGTKMLAYVWARMLGILGIYCIPEKSKILFKGNVREKIFLFHHLEVGTAWGWYWGPLLSHPTQLNAYHPLPPLPLSHPPSS